MNNFNPDKVWERSVSWKNHYSYIKSHETKMEQGVDIQRRGTVAVPGWMIDVHAAEFENKKGRGYAFTQLSAVGNGTMVTVTFKKCYSEQYCVTLAKRFAKQLEKSQKPETLNRNKLMAKNKEKTMIEAMAEDLKDIRIAIERLEKMGFSRELMEIYIYKKTSVNLTDVRTVLDTQKNFLEEAFTPLEELEDGEES